MVSACASCGGSAPGGARFCPGCGAALEDDGGLPPPPPGKKDSRTTLIILLAVGGGLLLLCGGVAVVAAIAVPNLLAAKLSSNETAAIATLRNLASAQAQFQVSGKVDGDGDGIGEYGTLLELTGLTGLRKPLDGEDPRAGTGFARKGPPLSPAFLSPSLANVDAQGIVTKNGYGYMVFLPDTASPPGFVHEIGPGASAGLSGGTGAVGVDASEQRWCAYAWPIAPGNSGNRAFYVDQDGEVLQSPNTATRWAGTSVPIDPTAALTGTSFDSPPAAGARGRDGNDWTPVD